MLYIMLTSFYFEPLTINTTPLLAFTDRYLLYIGILFLYILTFLEVFQGFPHNGDQDRSRLLVKLPLQI